MQENKVKVAIIGGGPAGYTAALYTARSDLSPLVFEGLEPGGQLMLTEIVENYPGFPDGILGPDLMDRMRKQAERFGAMMVPRTVEKVDFSSRPFKLWVEDGTEILADAVIIATGASARWLEVPGEAEFRGKGVSACATCDGAFFRDMNVMVVGGGDTAAVDALFLTKFAKKVTIVHRRSELRAAKVLQKRLFENEKIDFLWDSVIVEFYGDKLLKGVKVKNVKTGEIKEVPVDGVFVAIGHKPNTDIFKGQIDMDEHGYIITKPKSTETSVKGVFAAGDVQDPIYQQAVTAAATGCMAALEVEKYLAELES